MPSGNDAMAVMRMTRTLVIFFVVFSSGWAPGWVWAQGLVPAGPRTPALTREFVDELLSEPDEAIDLNRDILRVTQQAEWDLSGERLDIDAMERRLAAMARDLTALLAGQTDPGDIIPIINQYLFGEQQFRVDRSRLFESSQDALLLNRVLKNKQGQCLSLSLIYLCLAERLDLPLYGVMVPGHFFVRYADGQEQRNIEATDQGRAYDDASYQGMYLRGIADPGELKALTKKETIAIYLSNLANQYKLSGDHNTAMAVFQRVIELMPNRASLYTNLGNTYERDRQIFKAIACYHHALSLNPYLCEAHYNLGLAHFLYTRRYADARRHGEVARKLGCPMHPRFRAFLDGPTP